MRKTWARWLVAALIAVAVAGRTGRGATNDLATVDGAPLPVLTVTAREVGPLWVFGQSDSIALDLNAEPRLLVNSQGGASSQNDLSIRAAASAERGLRWAVFPCATPRPSIFTRNCRYHRRP